MTKNISIHCSVERKKVSIKNGCNEGTKVQNPRCLCHVHCIYIATLIDSRREEARYNIHIYTCIDTAILCIRGQMRECTGKYTEIWQRQKL